MRRVPGDVLVAVANGSPVGLVDPGDAVEERGLAGAVRPDEPDDLPLADVEVDTFQGLEAAEPDGDVPGFEDLRHGAVPLRLRKLNSVLRRGASRGASGSSPSLPSPAATVASSEAGSSATDRDPFDTSRAGSGSGSRSGAGAGSGGGAGVSADPNPGIGSVGASVEISPGPAGATACAVSSSADGRRRCSKKSPPASHRLIGRSCCPMPPGYSMTVNRRSAA